MQTEATSLSQEQTRSQMALLTALRRAAYYLLLTLVFSTAYTQSPLFTSNQNQYFLHGLAHAGYGYLHEDWLANTLDPTPVFSFLVEITSASSSLPRFPADYALLLDCSDGSDRDRGARVRRAPYKLRFRSSWH